MLMDKMRQGAQSTAAKIIFVVIMVSFALAGVGTYAVRKPNTDPAEVNGVTIDSMRFDMEYRNQKQMMQRRVGEHFSELLAADPQFLSKLRMQILDNMIDGVILDQRASEVGFHISDATIQRIIVNDIDAFKVDGKFNNDHYLNVITRAGYQSANQFAHDQKLQMVDNLYQGTFTNAQFVLPYENRQATALFKQKRNVDVYTINPSDLIKVIKATDEDLQSYYNQNKNNYIQSEQVKLDYILLNKKKLQESIPVSDDDVKKYYVENQKKFTDPAKFHAEHIFVNMGKDEDAQKKQLDKITEAEKAIKSGTPFEEVALKYSEDVLTAKKGGDLEWQRFGVLESEFDAAFKQLSMDNRVSDIIKTKYGYHIIKFMGIQADKLKPIEEVKEDIKHVVAAQQVDDIYAKAYDNMVTLANEFPDDLDSIASEMKLEIAHSNLFDADTTVSPFDNRQLKSLAFSQSFRDDGMNSEAIRLDDDNVIVFKVAEYKPQYVKPFDEVKKNVDTDYKLVKASSLASDKIVELQSMLKAKKPVDAFMAENSVVRKSGVTMDRVSSEFDLSVIEHAFALPKQATELNSDTLKGMDGQHYLVVLNKVEEVNTADFTADQTVMIDSQLKQINSVRDTSLMRQQLREDSDIEINTYALKQYESMDNSDMN